MNSSVCSQGKLVVFGETMLRLSPPSFRRLEQTEVLNVTVGGSELNVAVAAQRLGLPSAYVTRLPTNPLGRMITGKAREHGVNTDHVVWADDGRAGLYFVEFGASPRANSVLYDRADSAMARIAPGQVDWESAFSGARHFHTSGITPALSDGAAQATLEALQAARRAGMSVSVDLNYRARLWSQAEARQMMSKLMEFTNVLITTEEDTERVFGITASDYEQVAHKLAQAFNLDAVAITLRETPSVWRNSWSAMAYAGGETFLGPRFEIEIVDRVGAGDAFAGGFLYGWLVDGLESGVRYGVAMSTLKQTNPGDLCWGTKSECDRLLSGGSLRIQR